MCVLELYCTRGRSSTCSHTVVCCCCLRVSLRYEGGGPAVQDTSNSVAPAGPVQAADVMHSGK